MQSWWVKKRRAANPTDYETWQQGGVSPTLNAFDNGNDTRATVIIGQLFEPQSMKEENWVDRDIKNSIRAGESKSSHVVIFTAQRVGEPPRIYEDITPSLLSRMGTGGNNTPMIVQNNPSHDVVGTLQARMHKGANHEAARDGQLIPTTMIAFAQNQRDEVRDLNNVAGALAAQPGMKQQTFLANTSFVRRLTPVECERLMGWPDNHTLHRADGKTNSDSTRYKMCGNGVATPVAYWIAEQLLPLLNDD